MPHNYEDPTKRTVFHMPLALNSASRQFSDTRLCAYALYATTDCTGVVMGWHVCLENWKPGLYEQTREEIACRKYLADEWIEALVNYANRCFSAGLDAGYDFHQIRGLGGKE
jgi:hypothetical protein